LMCANMSYGRKVKGREDVIEGCAGLANLVADGNVDTFFPCPTTFLGHPVLRRRNTVYLIPDEPDHNRPTRLT
jgi:hypothetical protein